MYITHIFFQHILIFLDVGNIVCLKKTKTKKKKVDFQTHLAKPEFVCRISQPIQPEVNLNIRASHLVTNQWVSQDKSNQRWCRVDVNCRKVRDKVSTWPCFCSLDGSGKGKSVILQLPAWQPSRNVLYFKFQ